MSNDKQVSFIVSLNTAATIGHVPSDEDSLCDKATVLGAWIKGTLSNYKQESFIVSLNTAAATGHVPVDAGCLCDKATVLGDWIKGTLCITVLNYTSISYRGTFSK